MEGSPHSEMTDIWVRYRDMAVYEQTGDWAAFVSEPFEAVWYPVTERIPEIFPLVGDVVSATAATDVGAVFITKLPAGGKIDVHVDAGWHADTYDKYYLAVSNPVGSVFAFEDGDIHAKDGDLWAFDNSVPHCVDNNSDKERIAMIVCVKQTKFSKGGSPCQQVG
jgi:hypothetical protein